MTKTTQDIKKVKKSFVTPLDHCALYYFIINQFCVNNHFVMMKNDSKFFLFWLLLLWTTALYKTLFMKPYMSNY